MHFNKAAAAVGLSFLAKDALAIDLDVDNATSVRAAAKTIAESIISRYNDGSGIPGLFGQPYYFWESGLAWDSLINYQYLTGDMAYSDLIGKAITFQMGPDRDFLPSNQTKSEGNDDQAYWALAAMTAAELGFSIGNLNVSWAQLAQNVFEEQAARWDTKTCNGGLRWQIFAFNNGYNYKNSMSNGAFFQLAARLGLYTGNQTYIDWAEKVFNWSLDVGLVANASQGMNAASVYDGTDSATGNCTRINHIEWTATLAQYLAGSTFWYNNSQTLISSGYESFIFRANATFASLPQAGKNGTLTEVACALNNNCNVDQLAFRATLARSLAQCKALTRDRRFYHAKNVTLDNGQTVPSPNYSEPEWTIHERINFVLQTSARGAAAQCSGGEDGTTCGSDWSNSAWDGTQGLGQDLSALNVILANLPAGKIANINDTRPAPASGSSGNDTSNNGATGTSGGGAAIATASGAAGLPASSFALMAGIALTIAFAV